MSLPKTIVAALVVVFALAGWVVHDYSTVAGRRDAIEASHRAESIDLLSTWSYPASGLTSVWSHSTASGMQLVWSHGGDDVPLLYAFAMTRENPRFVLTWSGSDERMEQLSVLSRPGQPDVEGAASGEPSTSH